MSRIACRFTVALVVLISLPALADKRKDVQPAAKTVDQGAFGIFVNGRRIATESFHIQQKTDGSVASSELLIDDSTIKASQKSELLLGIDGSLRSYNWRELSPGKAQTSVEGGDLFVVERITPNPSEKPHELTHMLPPSTLVLDDYFFTHREILLWRYLADGDCKQSAGGMECRLEPAKFGVFVPRQHRSAMVEVAYRGRENVTINGTQRELSRFAMQAEDTEWALWLDDTYKLVRVLIASENVEVLRE